MSAIEKLQETLIYLSSLDIEEIVLLGGVPQYQPSLPDVLMRNFYEPNQLHTVHADLSAVNGIDTILSQLAENSSKVHFLRATSVFCDGLECTAVINSSDVFVPVAWDYAHLTQDGASFLAERLIEVLANE